MKVKLDENVTQEAVAVLVDAGHDVHTVRSEQLVGASDAAVWDACVREQRMLITFDLGFAACVRIHQVDTVVLLPCG
ncbi:MAG TPA: DUF5615 family PIN-like protein [Mycobacterium sp.]|nr:DUF5615 family PIN-like protein [Mycobacterium sp.]